MVKKFVVGILCKDGKYLAEKRKMDEEYNPGAIIFPGGHVEENETPEQALIREIKEELGVAVKEYSFIGEFTYEDGASSKVYAITKWTGDPKPIEADGIFWINDGSQLSKEIDKNMLKEVKRVFK